MDDSGAIAPSGRFDRIEQTLYRIEQKLDHKVDQEDFNAAMTRISLLESGDTPLGRVMLQQFSEFQRQVTDLTLHGSTHARELDVKVARDTARIDKLEDEMLNRKAVIDERRKRDETRYQHWAVALAGAQILSVLISVTALIASHL